MRIDQQSTSSPPFVGRDRELAALGTALEDARAGHGCLVLVSGEPGIGKSQLLGQFAHDVGRRDVGIHWGFSWEAGGAPSYWPWIQILRSLLDSDGADESLTALGPRGRPLRQLLPEMADSAGAQDLQLEPDQARFRLMDAFAGMLAGLARQAPLVLVLEDLHAADPDSILLLGFLARQLQGIGALVIGSFRAGEASNETTGPLLRQVKRNAREIRLGALTRSQLRQQVGAATGSIPKESTVAALWETTEGNPLYLVELVELLVSRGELDRFGDGAAPAIPRSITAAIRERIGTLPGECLELMGVASILGREFHRDELEALMDRGAAEPDSLLDETGRAGLLTEAAAGRYRFSHMLIREVLHDDLPGERRRDLHRRRAEILQRASEGGAEVAWSELAHHLAESGAAAREQAVLAATRAAEEASARYAFLEATRFYTRALEMLEQGRETFPEQRFELLLALGHTRIKTGDVPRGRENCRQAAELARNLGDAERMGRAALAYGEVFVYAKVDRELVGLLRESLRAHGEIESGLAARLQARLAAALQPADDPQEPFTLAREAIAMARRLGEPATLLATIRAGCSALMDLADPVERLPLNQEHVRLAEELGKPVEARRGHLRIVIDAVELGDLATADGSIAACQNIGEQLGLPHLQWPVAGLQAMRATMDGEFRDAEHLIRAATELSERAADPNAPLALLVLRAGLMRSREEFEGMAAIIPKIPAVFENITLGLIFAQALAGCLEARMETLEPAGSPCEKLTKIAFSLGDPSLISSLAEMAAAVGNVDLADRLYDRLLPRDGLFLHWGLLGMLWDGPVSRLLALLAEKLERYEEADAHFARALEQVRGLGAKPMVARTLYEHGRSLARGTDAARISRARPLLQEALSIAKRLEMTGLVTLAERLEQQLEERPPKTATGQGRAGVPRLEFFRLRREGELWLCQCEEDSFHLKDSKGLRMLAQLMAEPGKEFHVLDLSGAPASTGHARDDGDAGRLLDDQARSEYRRRVIELRDVIEEAEELQDMSRAEEARSEMEFIAAELSRAFGLGGRKRRAGAPAERARVNVRRRLQDAIKKIAARSPAAGRHLDWAVRTGTYCSYSP